ERLASGLHAVSQEERPLRQFNMVVVGQELGRHPSSFERLFRHAPWEEFASRVRIVWIEAVGLRRPKPHLRDVKRAIERLVRTVTGRAPGATKPPTLIGVEMVKLTPLLLPFNDVAWVRRLNHWLLRRAAKKGIERLGL